MRMEIRLAPQSQPRVCSGSGFKAFLRQPERPRSGISYSQKLPAAETKFTFEQREQTLELRSLFVFHKRNLPAPGKSPQKGLR